VLYSNTSGISNTGNGYQSMYSNTVGYGNTTMGYKSLYSNTNGIFNTAIGYSALSDNQGSTNTAVGVSALEDNTTADQNTAVGGYALSNNTTGAQNTSVGRSALINNITGSNNTALGNSADGGAANSGMSNCTLLGYGTGGTNAGTNKVCVGNTSVTSIKGQVAFTTYSDERFKTNIKSETHGLDFINKLKPITYTVDIDRLNHFIYGPKADTLFGEAPMKKSIAENSKIVYNGFSAQQVEQAAKEVKYNFSGVDRPENSDKSPYGLRYSDFVVPLVKAVQELNAQNDSLKSENQHMQSQLATIVKRMNALELAQQQCRNNISSQSSISNSQSVILNDAARLEQNTPNPFNNNTVVRYHIPTNVNNAQIIITDMGSHIAKNISLSNKGSGQVTITAGTLASGNYIYSLIIDGKKVDSKQMILTK